MRALVLVADALLLGVTIVPARVGIHASHEHKRRGIFVRVFRPTDTYNPVLQWLPHHLQDISRKFRQSIQAEELVPFLLNLFVKEIVAIYIFHQVVAYLVLGGELQAVFAHEQVLRQPFGSILDRGFAIVGT